MARAFVSVGSNIRPAANVRAALRRLARMDRLVALSTVYRTEAIGRPGQPAYYNCVAELRTSRSPAALKVEVLRPIEAALGRVRAADRFAPRTIDLDLIVYGRRVESGPDLTLPDPLILRRPFLAAGLAELAPGLSLPPWGGPIRRIAAGMGRDRMTPLDAYTAALRREVVRLEPDR